MPSEPLPEYVRGWQDCFLYLTAKIGHVIKDTADEPIPSAAALGGVLDPDKGECAYLPTDHPLVFGGDDAYLKDNAEKFRRAGEVLFPPSGGQNVKGAEGDG